MRYDRTVIAYHGCDEAVARRLLKGDRFRPSENDYDWLGTGIYFWEYAPDRAFRFAVEQRARGKVKKPAVVGALVQLGNCFDLMDTRFTKDLSIGYQLWLASMKGQPTPLPRNAGAAPDRLLRRLDCAVLNWYLSALAAEEPAYDTVRCGFVEGGPVFEGAGVQRQSHVQIAVRNPACIIGLFRPNMKVP